MKNSIKTLLLASLLITFGCKQGEETASEPTSESTEVPTGDKKMLWIQHQIQTLCKLQLEAKITLHWLRQ